MKEAEIGTGEPEVDINIAIYKEVRHVKELPTEKQLCALSALAAARQEFWVSTRSLLVGGAETNYKLKMEEE